MFTRRFFLKAMLWALGAAACSGVLVIFVSDRDLMWRIGSVAVAAAIAFAGMMFFSPLADRENTRAAGIGGMWLCILEFVLTIALLWMPVVFGRRTQEAWAWTMLSVFVTGAPAVVFLRLIKGAGSRAAGWAGLGVCAGALGVFEVAVVRETTGTRWSGAELWMTGWIVLVWGCTAALSLVRARPGVAGVLLRLLGLIGAVGCCVVSLIGVWGRTEHSAALVWSGGAAVVGMVANLSFAVRLTPGQAWVRLGTIGVMSGSAVLVGIVATLDDFHESSQIEMAMLRVAGAGAIAAVSGCLAMLVLGRLNKRVDFQKNDTAITEITLLCPRCGRKQVMPIGAGFCAGCKLRVSVRVQTPRCVKCEYDLSGIEGDKCPECGTVIDFSGPPATA